MLKLNCTQFDCVINGGNMSNKFSTLDLVALHSGTVLAPAGDGPGSVLHMRDLVFFLFGMKQSGGGDVAGVMSVSDMETLINYTEAARWELQLQFPWLTDSELRRRLAGVRQPNGKIIGRRVARLSRWIIEIWGEEAEVFSVLEIIEQEGWQ